MRNGSSSDDLGHKGEKRVEVWAAESDFDAHEADRDRRGWDFFIQFPLHPDGHPPKGPLDKRPTDRLALLQVKSTNDPDKRSWPIKLSNWDKLIRSNAPTFFLILHFNGQDVPEEAYLVPVWKEQIRKVQKRLRELSAEGVEAIHKRKLTLTWDEENRLPEPSGRALVDRMRDHIGKDLFGYLQTRQELIDTVGYEEAAQELLVQVEVPEEYRDRVGEMWVDLALGLLEELEVAGGEVYDLRFGIPSPEPQGELPEGGALRPGQLAEKQVVLTLRTDETGAEVCTPGTLVVPAGIGEFLTPENLKFRFTTPLLDLVFRPAHDTVRTKIGGLDPDEPRAFGELFPSADLIWMIEQLRRNDREALIEIEDFELGVLDPPEFPDRIVEWANGARAARVVLRHLGLPVDETEVKPRQFGEQSTELDRIATAIRDESNDLTFWSGLEEGATDEEKEELEGLLSAEELYIPEFRQVLLGEKAIQYAIVNQADGESATIQKGSRLQIPITAQTVEYTEVLDQGEDEFSFDVEDFLDRLEDQLEGPGEQLIRWWDEEKMTEV